MPGRTLEDRAPAVPDAAAVLLRCAFDRSALAPLRGRLNRTGVANGLTGVALAHFVLAVNEITTNAVRYAGGHGMVCLSRHLNDIWCVVEDDGPGIARRHLQGSQRRDSDQIGGHGIWLARHICASLAFETGRATGTRVVMRFAVRPGGLVS